MILTEIEKQAPMEDDLDLILEVLSGGRYAFAKIVRKYEFRVRAHCLVMLADPTQAEDASQEVFIKAHKSLGQFRHNAAFSTWLYRITANHCTDLLRKRGRKRTESWEALVEKEGEKIEALLATPAPAESSMEQAELIAKLLSPLAEKDREILILRETQGLNYQELAKTLGCSLDAVKSRLKRVRQEIRKNLRHFFPDRDV